MTLGRSSWEISSLDLIAQVLNPSNGVRAAVHLMKISDYPGLFGTSDLCAVSSQKKYFLLTKTRIAVLLVIAAVASFAWVEIPVAKTPVALVVAVSLVVSLSLGALLDKRRYDKSWFGCRALAESVKVETWLFMARAPPYNGASDTANSEETFLQRLKQLLDRQQQTASEMAAHFTNTVQITSKMREIRSWNLDERMAYYSENRVHDQLKWYTVKAQWNEMHGSRWSLISWGLQLIAVVVAVLVVGFGTLIFSPVGILTTASVGSLSWGQARSFRQLSESYGLVAQELSFHADRITRANDEQKFTEIVLDVERTISREHTMWLARRTGQATG